MLPPPEQQTECFCTGCGKHIASTDGIHMIFDEPPKFGKEYHFEDAFS